MVFDKYDFELLRLCGVCRYIPTGLSKRFDEAYFSPAVIATLRSNGYIKIQSDKKSYKLTFAGKEVLADMGYTFPEDSRMDLKRKSYQRKLKNAVWNVMLHISGIDIFADKTISLADIDTGYVSSLTLRADADIRVLAGTRFLGILKIYDTVYIPYYIEGTEDWIVPRHEAEIFRSQVGTLKSVRDIKLILTGESLEELWKNIHPPDTSEIQGRGMKRFDEALEELACDYLLVPTNRDGAVQMSIMKIWRYRERIARAMGCSVEKVYNLSECDGFKENTPYIIAIDFDVKRIVRALKQVERYNDKIVPKVCCLTFQKRTLKKLLHEYGAPDSTVVSIQKESLYNGIFKDCISETTEQNPFIKEGGGCINANQRKVTKANNDEC